MIRPAVLFMLVNTAVLFPIWSPPLLVAQSAAADEEEVRDDPEAADPGEERSLRGSQQPPAEPLAELDLEAALAQQIHYALAKGFPLGIGIGLLSFTDQQGSLQNSFSQSTVTLRDPASGTSDTTILDVDPKLNNRKFDFELDLQGSGIYVPLELARPNGAQSMTLSFGVAETDVNFDVFDETRFSELSSSFGGSDPTYMVGLSGSACVAGGCRWKSGGEYHYWNLPSLDVGRSVPIGAPCIEVLEDSVTLSREAHEFSTRIWHSIDTKMGSYSPYTGVLYRSTTVEIVDNIRFRDGFALETTQRTVSRFESDVVLGIVGVEAELGSLSGRLETVFGDDDYGVRFQVAWSKKAKIPLKWVEKLPERRAKRVRRWIDKREKRLEKVYPRLEREIKAAEFDWPADKSIIGSTISLRAVVERLFEEARDALVKALSRPKEPRRHKDLAPYRDYVTYHADLLLEELRAGPPATTTDPGRQNVSVVVLAVRLVDSVVLPAQDASDDNENGWLDSLVRDFRSIIFGVLGTAIEKTECRFAEFEFLAEQGSVLDLVVYTSPNIILRKNIPHSKVIKTLPRALYGFRVRSGSKNGPIVECNKSKPSASGCSLDLLLRPCPQLQCALDDHKCNQLGIIKLPLGCKAGAQPKCDG